MGESWKSDTERWLAPFIGALRHETRARVCPAYVSGLIGAGDRKSVQPMAARDGDMRHQSPQKRRYPTQNGKKNHLAARNERPAHMSLCRASRSCRRWPQAPHARSSHATYAGRGGLARRRAPVLCIQLTSQCEPQNACHCNQSQMGLRAGTSAAQGRTRPRSLRRPVLDRLASICLDDNDRLCLSPIPPPQSSGTEKKGSAGRRRNRACQPSDRPSLTSSRGHHQHDVPTA
jgi:hypothetical protein